MSRARMDFKELLDSVAQDDSLEVKGTVYGVVPPNTGMTYPAIRYESALEEAFYADNVPYEVTDGYTVTVIESDPNKPISKLVRKLPMCAFNRSYVADNLHHTVYNIFF